MMARLGPGPVIFAAFWLFFMAAGQSRLLRDPGTLWHTRVGEIVLERGFFEGDPFTFSHAGQRWVPHQWLGEVVMALAYRVSGFDAFILLAATVLATLFTWMTLRLYRTGLHLAVVLAVAACALAATASHLHVRPLLFTTVAMAAIAALLCDADAGRLRLAKLFWLVPLFIAWTNTHGGMLGGLASLALVVAGWIVARLCGWPSPVQTGRQAAALVLLVAACALTAFANPYGWEIPRAWLLIMRAPKIPQLIEEHQPLDPAMPAAWGVILFAAVYLFVLAGTRQPRIAWLLPLFWLAQSFLRVRHAPLFACTAFIAIAAMWPHTRWAAWLLHNRPDVQAVTPPRPASRLAWCLPVLLVLTTLGLQIAGIRVPIIGAGWARLDSERWPVEILNELKEHEPKPGEPNRIFNDCTLGGFLMFFTPGYRTFFDDRAELYGEQFFDEFTRASEANTAAEIEGWQRRFGTFDFAFVRPQTPFDQYFRERGWRELARCGAAVLYSKPDD